MREHAITSARCTALHHSSLSLQRARRARVDKRLSDLSGGRLPPLKECRYEALGGNHLSMALRSFKGAPHTVSDQANLIAQSGKIDLARVTMGQPMLAEAIQEGLVWHVLHRKIHVHLPELLPYVQQALNYDVREGLGEVEMILCA